MQITGHVREHTFLQYVNRTQNKDVFALNFIEALEKTKQGHSSRS
jgi:phosphoglycerol transferase MdoB-like AlkP superfamily enzyme